MARFPHLRARELPLPCCSSNLPHAKLPSRARKGPRRLTRAPALTLCRPLPAAPTPQLSLLPPCCAGADPRATPDPSRPRRRCHHVQAVGPLPDLRVGACTAACLPCAGDDRYAASLPRAGAPNPRPGFLAPTGLPRWFPCAGGAPASFKYRVYNMPRLLLFPSFRSLFIFLDTF